MVYIGMNVYVCIIVKNTYLPTACGPSIYHGVVLKSIYLILTCILELSTPLSGIYDLLPLFTTLQNAYFKPFPFCNILFGCPL